MTDMTIIAVIALCLYPPAKKGMQEVVMDIAQIIAWIIKTILTFCYKIRNFPRGKSGTLFNN